MIRRVFAERTTVATDGVPPVRYREWAYARCGCAVIIGHRLDSEEPALVTGSCAKPAHAGVGREVRRRYIESVLLKPSCRPAVEVADEILGDVLAVAGEFAR